MQYGSVKKLIKPLIKSGHDWQFININGDERKPKFYFSNVQWVILLISGAVLFKLTGGISDDIVGYIMGAFSISVSLFMSLLVSIFDKFENTSFEKGDKDEQEIVRLKQKKNFFKRFISITSYLVILSILVVALAGLTYLFNLSEYKVSRASFTLVWKEIDVVLTIKNSLIILYRLVLNYFLLNYLFLTLFVTGSAFEYYMSEISRRKIE